MSFIDIELDGVTYRAKLLEDVSPVAVSALQAALPLSVDVVHEQVSGSIFSTRAPVDIEHSAGDKHVGFQHPGLVVFDPATSRLAICYGQGRLNSLTGPTEAIPVAEIGGDLAPLEDVGYRLQFDGAKSMSIRSSADQDSPPELAPAPAGRKIRIVFGEADLTATLLDEISPNAASAFADLLPLEGVCTNTHSSGSLTRFWNPDGGKEGETVLETDELDEGQVVLYPGYIYYLTKVGFRGLRIPRDASMMRSALGGGGSSRLIPLAKFDGDFSAFRDQAERVHYEGAKPMSISLLD